MAACCDDYHAGMLREPVTIERAARVGDIYGGITETWSAVNGSPDRAYIKPLSGREVYQFDRVEAHASVMMVIRYFADIQERDRVTIRSREYNIRHIRNVEMRDRWLEVTLSEGEAF